LLVWCRHGASAPMPTLRGHSYAATPVPTGQLTPVPPSPQ